MVDLDLTRLTPGERLFVDRLRRGETQEQAASRLGVGQRAYGAAETDRGKLPKGLTPRRIRPSKAEQCRLARRRRGLNLRATAAALGCSHVSLLESERAGSDWLVRAWTERGFQFTR